MKAKALKYVYYFLFCAICYFTILPVSFNIEGAQFMALLIILPLVILVGSSFWGALYKFNIVPPIIAGALFIPTVFIFMNSSAMVYAAAYAVIALAGVAIGHICYSLQRRK